MRDMSADRAAGHLSRMLRGHSQRSPAPATRNFQHVAHVNQCTSGSNGDQIPSDEAAYFALPTPNQQVAARSIRRRWNQPSVRRMVPRASGSGIPWRRCGADGKRIRCGKRSCGAQSSGSGPAVADHLENQLSVFGSRALPGVELQVVADGLQRFQQPSRSQQSLLRLVEPFGGQRAGFPSPTMRYVFGPCPQPRPCPAPCMMGSSGTPRRMSAPTLRGVDFMPRTVSGSMSGSSTIVRIPADWAASVCSTCAHGKFRQSV
jgi:hypothetical protein